MMKPVWGFLHLYINAVYAWVRNLYGNPQELVRVYYLFDLFLFEFLMVDLRIKPLFFRDEAKLYAKEMRNDILPGQENIEDTEMSSPETLE